MYPYIQVDASGTGVCGWDEDGNYGLIENPIAWMCTRKEPEDLIELGHPEIFPLPDPIFLSTNCSEAGYPEYTPRSCFQIAKKRGLYSHPSTAIRQSISVESF